MDLPAAPLCLRVISRGGQVVAFSGDTELCPGLFMAADGADLVVAECTALFPPAGRHITWDDWQDALPKIRARRVLLSHLGESVRANIPNLTPPRGSPPIEFADDGRVIDLAPPSGGSR
jgi:ribonuclease BN (tRNA processing enzyme)